MYLKVPSRHDLVRRYTDQLDEDRLLLEVGAASECFQKGQALYRQTRYFDCVEQLSEALDCFNTMEPPTQSLKTNLPQVYALVKDCYLLSADCYTKMDQQESALVCLKAILKTEPEDVETLFLRGQALEIRQETA